MKSLLQVNSSLNASAGYSTQLANRFVAAWRAHHPETTLQVRDLAVTPIPHLTAERFEAFRAKPNARTEVQQGVVNFSDALIDEIRRADVIVLGLPLYNFGVPSVLKAYFDHIARAGVTFRYTEKGSVGLLGGKKIYVLAARGGVYAGTARDTETAYVRDFLQFLGLDDIEFIYAEGLAVSESSKQVALAHAHLEIERAVATSARAAAA